MVPPFVEYCSVPPVPLTLPMAIDPPLTAQFTQLLLVIESVPVGADGMEQVPGAVVPTRILVLRHPFVPNTLA